MKVKILKEIIREKGLRQDFLAKKLNLSQYGFSLKLNGKNEFKWSEIEKLISILNLNDSERDKIFFSWLVILKHILKGTKRKEEKWKKYIEDLNWLTKKMKKS